MGFFSKSDSKLIAQLQHRDADKRRRAIEKIGERRLLEAGPALVEVLARDPVGNNKVQAVIALHRFEEHSPLGAAAAALSTAFRGSADNDRPTIADAMGYLSSPVCFSDIAAAAEAPYPRIRVSGRRSLGRLGLPWALYVLRPGLSDVDQYAQVAAIEALGLLAHPLAFYDLVPLMQSNITIHNAAQNSLRSIARFLGGEHLLFLGTLGEDLDTLQRLVESRGVDTAKSLAQLWLQQRRVFVRHLLEDTSLGVLAQGFRDDFDAYCFAWSRALLDELHSIAASSGDSERADAVERFANG